MSRMFCKDWKLTFQGRGKLFQLQGNNNFFLTLYNFHFFLQGDKNFSDDSFCIVLAIVSIFCIFLELFLNLLSELLSLFSK